MCLAHAHLQGTSDTTPWLSVPAALAMLQALGPAKMVSHNHEWVRMRGPVSCMLSLHLLLLLGK